MTDAVLEGKRAKRIALLALVAGAGLAMLAWSQTWFTFEIALDPGTTPGVSRGETAAPALMALALAALAGVAGLALAGPVFRVVLGALEALLGATILLVTGVALASPLGAVSAEIAEKTGVSGVGGTSVLVVDGTLTASPWPWVALLAGVVVVTAGVRTIATARRWPGSSRKYGARFADASSAGEAASNRAPGDDRVDQWDALSHGDDPTGAEQDPTTASSDAVDDPGTDRAPSVDEATAGHEPGEPDHGSSRDR